MNRTLAILAVLAVCAMSACNSSNSIPTAPSNGGELIVTDLRAGTGATAGNLQRLSVAYTGWLFDDNAAENKGAIFDSRLSSQPFSFVLGRGEVIAGWDQGLPGMRVGGLRRLTIPPDLAYGEQGFPDLIPPNATLIFEVDLLSAQ